MNILNTTFLLPKSHYQRWGQWVKDIYIPILEAYVTMGKYRVLKVCNPMNDDESSFSVQFDLPNSDSFEILNRKIAENLSREFGQEILCFSTLLETIEI